LASLKELGSSPNWGVYIDFSITFIVLHIDPPKRLPLLTREVNMSKSWILSIQFKVENK
jgi:hypothetical protein